MRVLYVAGEVAPFSTTTSVARLARLLPEHLYEREGYEVRVFMPRYGTVSERRNRLHEVIRLSGAEIQVGDTKGTLNVKVASVPGIRLQVYFLDNVHFFKRKGIYKDRKTEQLFEDNAERALYFARAVFDTTTKLGWAPDILHASGWISAFAPALLKTELAEHELFASTKSVYTPDDADVDVRLSAERATELGLPEGCADRELRVVGADYADVVATGDAPSWEDAVELVGEDEDILNKAIALYSELSGITVPDPTPA